jgi:hypothetical protein
VEVAPAQLQFRIVIRHLMKVNSPRGSPITRNRTSPVAGSIRTTEASKAGESPLA